MSPETKELTVPPTSGLAPNITPDDLKLPPAVTQRAPSMQPMVQFESQLLAILTDIDATPSPVTSPATAAQQSVDASPLTERALRYHRRDAIRTDRNSVAPVPLPSSTDPLDTFGAEMHKKDRFDLTPAPPNEPLHSTIQSKIPSLGPDHYRPTSARGQFWMPLACNTPATFPRVTQAIHMTEHRSFSACLRCPSRAPSSNPPSRASRRYAMSSSSTSSSAPKATAKSSPSVRGTASPGLTAKPGKPQGTSSPVASSTRLAASPSPVAPSTLRAISGSGTDRTRGLRPDSPVPPRAFMYDPLGPPALFGCLHQVWDDLEPTLRARITSISLEAVETSLAHARAAANIGDQARPAADACALAMAEEEHALVMRPLQARAALLDSAHAGLWDRLRHCDTQRRSTATEIATAERHHRAFAANIGTGSRQPPRSRRDAPRGSGHLGDLPRPHCVTATTHDCPCPSTAPGSGHIYGLYRTRGGNTMPPPPPPATRASFTTAALWSVVAARHPRQPPPTPRDDRYLDLRLSKLMHVNSFFLANTRKPIKTLASQVEATIKSLHIENRTLRLAVELATQDGSGFCDPLVNDILRLRDLVDRAYATPAGAGWVRKVLGPAAAPRRPARSASSGSDTASSVRPRRRDDPSSGRGNSKRATLSETSDSDDRHSRYQGRHHPDKRQVTARIYQVTDDDSDALSFPPRVFRYRNRSRRPHPRIATPRADCAAPVTNDFLPLQKIVEAATAAAIAAVDYHLAHLGLTSRPETPPSHGTVHHSRSHPIPRSDTAPSHDTVLHRLHAVPRPETASLHGTVPHYHSRAIPAPLAPLAPPTGLVVPTTEPSAISARASCPLGGSAAVADPSSVTPTHNGYSFAPLVPTPAPLQPPAPTTHPAISIAPAPAGPFPHGPPDERTLCDDSSSQTSSNLSPSGLRADFVAHMQAACCTLDMRRVPRIQPLQFPPSADRTAATQLLIRSMRDALSGIFDVAYPTGTVTMDSPVWVSGWNAPLLKLTKAAINANRDDTHDLHRLIDDLFSQLKERVSSGSGGPAAFKTLLTDFADYFDRAPRGAALETLQKFGVRTGTLFSSYLRALRVVVASTVEKGGPLAPSATMAIELVRIRTAQQYPTLMPTLFPGDRATREKPYASLALMWTAFADLKYNTSPAINGDAFASAPQVPSSHALPPINPPTASVTASQRHSSQPSRLSHT